jgi:tRNA nucleotidyltransferase (CCA-adding enzyme)
MGDYMFMLESHLTAGQNRVAVQVAGAATEMGLNVYLVGGAVRDMLGGFPVRDLDFVVEGNPAKLVKALQKLGAEITALDNPRKSYDLMFPGRIPASLGVARQETYSKLGKKPQIREATIYEHLRSRDFTINAVALSLSRGSRGLLIDPTNGAGDLMARELRSISPYAFYDEPVRMLRMARLQVRLGLSVEPRTLAHFENAREANVQKQIPAAALRRELLHTAEEPNPGDVIRAIEANHLLTLFSPALTGAKINHAGFQKLQKALQAIPYGSDLALDRLGMFLFTLGEPLSPKERTQLIKTSGLTSADVAAWQKLEARAKKLERALKSASLKKPSQVYRLLRASPGDEILFLLARSQERLAQDRLKNYLQKYLPAAQEVTDADVAQKGAVAGTPKFKKFREELIAQRLDSRPKRPPTPEPVAPAAAAPRRFN